MLALKRIDPDSFGTARRTKPKLRNSPDETTFTKKDKKLIYSANGKYAEPRFSDRWPGADVPQNNISKFRREEYDLYDIILSHLLDKGYAETPEAAEAIMVNMSEEWRDSIIECD